MLRGVLLREEKVCVQVTQSMSQVKANSFFNVRLFRTVNMLLCSECPKTRDRVMMEPARGFSWETPQGHSQAHCEFRAAALQLDRLDCISHFQT